MAKPLVLHLSRAAHRLACCPAPCPFHCVRCGQRRHRAQNGSIHSRSSPHRAVQGVKCGGRAYSVAARQARLRRSSFSLHAVSPEFFVPIANPSNSRVEIPAGTPIAAIAPVALTANSPSTAATNLQLSRNEKLRKVLRELQVDVLLDSTPHKRLLV